jgi:formate dehydrogenase subunit beta
MPKMLRTQTGTEQGIRDLLRFLLESGKVRGVLCLGRLGSNGAVSYSLYSDPAALDQASPLYPTMPANAGQLLSRLTLREPLDGPVAAVVRPCELRAFAELTKRAQGDPGNILTISMTCPGVVSLAPHEEESVDQAAYLAAAARGELAEGLRPTCRACLHFEPYTADMTVSLCAEEGLDRQTTIFVNTEAAEQMLDGYGSGLTDGSLDKTKMDAQLKKRESERAKLFGDLKVEEFGLSGLVEVYGRCVSCHGCSKVCPICYCEACDFESRDHEYTSSSLETELAKRGAMRLPPVTVLFQLGRMAHMAISCVGCGMCSDVCPADIPVATIFSKVGEASQQSFDYVPGRSFEEEVPLAKFEVEEFAEVGE